MTAFLEKDPEPVDRTRSTPGCYVFRRIVIDAIPTGRPVSVERETFPGLLAAGELVVGHVDPGYWLDLGTPADFVRGLVPTWCAASPVTRCPGRWASSRADRRVVARRRSCTAGTTIGAGAGRRRRDGAGSVVFDDAVIEAGAEVRESVIGRGAVIGPGTVVKSAVIGDGARVGARNSCAGPSRCWRGW